MLALVLAIFAGDAHAWQVRTNDSGKELRWQKRSIHYTVDASGDHGLSHAAVDSMIAAATRNWSASVETSIGFIHDGTASGVTNAHDKKNTIYFEDNWTHDPALVGLTFVWSRPDGEIIGFDMALNATDHDWSTDGSENTNDLLNTVSHEIGHALGVDHSPTVEMATMYPNTFPGELVKRDLDADDEAAMRYLYAGDRDTPEAARAGCSTLTTKAHHLAWLLLVPLLTRRRHR